jgi:UDP-glucose 4-epimerase
VKIFVTGGAGFIGSHLSTALVRAGHEVLAIDDLSTGRIENVAHLMSESGFRLLEGDIRDELLIDDAMRDANIVVHLAARIGLKVIVKSPLDTMQVNAHGSEVVLDAASIYGVPTIIASTSEVYGGATKIPSAESDPICFGSPTIGRWAYACAKAYDEFYALALHRERDFPVVVTRFFNTVGTRQTGRYGMVIPRFVEQALNNEPLTVYGDGSQTRCFCAVEDVVAGLYRIINGIFDFAGQVFNLGSPHEITILDLARRVIELTGSSSQISFVPFSEVYPEGFEEIMRRVPDISKARELLAFDPKTELDAILLNIITNARKELAV